MVYPAMQTRDRHRGQHRPAVGLAPGGQQHAAGDGEHAEPGPPRTTRPPPRPAAAGPARARGPPGRPRARAPGRRPGSARRSRPARARPRRARTARRRPRRATGSPRPGSRRAGRAVGGDGRGVVALGGPGQQHVPGRVQQAPSRAPRRPRPVGRPRHPSRACADVSAYSAVVDAKVSALTDTEQTWIAAAAARRPPSSSADYGSHRAPAGLAALDHAWALVAGPAGRRPARPEPGHQRGRRRARPGPRRRPRRLRVGDRHRRPGQRPGRLRACPARRRAGLPGQPGRQAVRVAHRPCSWSPARARWCATSSGCV